MGEKPLSYTGQSGPDHAKKCMMGPGGCRSHFGNVSQMELAWEWQRLPTAADTLDHI